MKIKNVLVIIFFLCLGSIKGIAFGFLQEDIMMHGFASQGYLKSSDNNYLGNSKDGSYEFNEIGVNFMVPVSDDLRFGIQLFSRDLGNYGNNDLVVDWALLDYNVNQYLGFRGGKVKMPFGMRNRSRDVDNLRIPIILNQAVYLEGLRDLVIALYGFNAYGAVSLGALGDLDYDILIGTIDVPENMAFIQSELDRMNLSADADVVVKHIEGGQILWATPLSGLSLSATAYQASIDLGMEIEVEPFPEPISISAETSLEKFCVYSIKYDIYRFSFIFEWLQMDTKVNITETTKITSKREGWYGEASWNVSDWLGLGLAYGEHYPDSTDKDGDRYVNGQGEGEYPDYYAWQKDTTFSTKFNVNEYLCLKFEVHYIDGLGLTEVSYYEPGEMKKHWLLYAFKTSINF